MRLSLVTPPADIPVSLDLFKAQIVMETDASDELLDHYLRVATAHFDGESGVLGRAIMPQTWELALDGVPSEIELPLPPLKEIVSITGDDEPIEGYNVVTGRTFSTVGFTSRPRVSDVRIRFICGYDDPPAPIKQAIMLLAANLEANREPLIIGTTVARAPMSIDQIVSPYRVWR